MVPENGIKKALREGRVALGSGLGELGTRGIAKILEHTGLDWVMIDMEHSGYSMDHVADLIAWFKATPITVLVRPPDNSPNYLSRIMDIGAMGVQVAHIESADEARAMVDAVMYPPLGHRGIGANSPHTDFQWPRPKTADYMPARNAQTTIVAMIESKAGVDNIEEIVAVPGIDIVHPSHNDLAVGLGIPQQFDHPLYKDAIRKVADACKRHGKALKMNPYDDEDIVEFYGLGCRVMGIRSTTAVAALQRQVVSEVDHLHAQLKKLGSNQP